MKRIYGTGTGRMRIGRVGIARRCANFGWLVCAALLPASVVAQNSATPSLHSEYSLAREVNLVGTVSSVVEDAGKGPLGTNVMVQTSGGLIDVHVGSAKFLKLNHLELAAGDSVRVIGETFASGENTVFLARIVQKGVTAVAVRSPKGMPLWRAGTRLQAAATTQTPGGAL